MLKSILKSKSKPFIVFLFSAISIGIMLFTVCISFQIVPSWYGVIVGLALMIAAIPMHIKARKKPMYYLLSFLINSVGNGFSVAACYTANHSMPDPFQLFFTSVPAFLLLLLSWPLLERFASRKKTVLAILFIINIMMAAATITQWLRSGSVGYSYGLFPLLLAFSYLCVLGVTVNHERPILRDISYGGFCAFIIITIVAIIVLSEGDFLDGFVPDVGGVEKKKKRNNDAALRDMINNK